MPYVMCLGYVPEDYEITGSSCLIQLHKNNDGEIFLPTMKLTKDEVIDTVNEFFAGQEKADPNKKSIAYQPRKDGGFVQILECGAE